MPLRGVPPAPLRGVPPGRAEEFSSETSAQGPNTTTKVAASLQISKPRLETPRLKEFAPRKEEVVQPPGGADPRHGNPTPVSRSSASPASRQCQYTPYSLQILTRYADRPLTYDPFLGSFGGVVIMRPCNWRCPEKNNTKSDHGCHVLSICAQVSAGGSGSWSRWAGASTFRAKNWECQEQKDIMKPSILTSMSARGSMKTVRELSGHRREHGAKKDTKSTTRGGPTK